MDVLELIGFGLSTFGISVGTAAWLGKRLIDHRLAKDLERQKTELQRLLDHEKTEWEGTIRERVDSRLADLAADREYSLEARKRLYLAIGPLRFQLLLACRDLMGRILSHVRNRYSTDLRGYYGRSFLFRILRPLAISDLIERQIAYADFSVDAGAIDLLRFRKNAFAALTGGSLVLDHPRINWNDEEQHVFFDHLARAASALIAEDPGHAPRCLRFEEFSALVEDPARCAALEPFPHLLNGFTPQAKPILWVRLLGLAVLCSEFINRAGSQIGFEKREIPCTELLAATQDPHIEANRDRYLAVIRALPESSL